MNIGSEMQELSSNNKRIAKNTLLLYFRITDDATGEVMDTADVILNGTEGTFQYIPSGYSADSYVFLSDGHTYTLEFF